METPTPNCLFILQLSGGGVVMIKGSLLISFTIIKRWFLVENFQARKSTFSAPIQRRLGGWICLKLTDNSFPLTSFSSCHIWHRTAFGRFKDYSFKQEHTRSCRTRKRAKRAVHVNSPGVAATRHVRPTATPPLQQHC